MQLVVNLKNFNEGDRIQQIKKILKQMRRYFTYHYFYPQFSYY